MGRKSKDKDKEYSDVQRLRYENQQLKKKLASLRKQIARLDLDRYQNIRDLLEYQDEETKNLNTKSKRQEMLDKWKCYKCEEGHLRLIILGRPDGLYYFRHCTQCENKTKLQKYTDSVEGIKE